jgi:hypothetical protein
VTLLAVRSLTEDTKGVRADVGWPNLVGDGASGKTRRRRPSAVASAMQTSVSPNAQAASMHSKWAAASCLARLQDGYGPGTTYETDSVKA